MLLHHYTRNKKKLNFHTYPQESLLQACLPILYSITKLKMKQSILRNIISGLESLSASIMNIITEYCCAHSLEYEIIDDSSLKRRLDNLCIRYPYSRFYKSIIQQIKDGQVPNNFRLLILVLCL